MNCILTSNFILADNIAFYVAAQIADNAVLVYGLDLVKIDGGIFGEHRAIFWRFDDCFFYVGGKAVGTVIRGGRSDDHSVGEVIEDDGRMREGELGLNIAAAEVHKDLIAPLIAVGFLFAFRCKDTGGIIESIPEDKGDGLNILAGLYQRIRV